MNFLIQTEDDQIVHDFSRTLIDACEYQNWFKDNNDCKYVKSNNCIFIPDAIPIGSVEFVEQYLKDYYKKDVKPRNIPEELMDFCYTGRKVINGTDKDIVGEKFVKSNDKIKAMTDICSHSLPGNYQISDVIEIESEWRTFVYKNEIVGLQCYSGDFLLFPDVYKIKSMIRSYKNSPIAYTLDVGIIDSYADEYIGNTVIIEVHDFFSCGFYGFDDKRIIPQMFSDWFLEFIK